MKTLLSLISVVLAAMAMGQRDTLPPTGDVTEIPTARIGKSLVPKKQSQVTTFSTLDERSPLPSWVQIPNEEKESQAGTNNTFRGQGIGQEDQSFGTDALGFAIRWKGYVRGAGDLCPSDTDVAAFKDWVVQVSNVTWTISDKGGKELFKQTFATTFSDATWFYFDPKVIFDPYSQRWVMLILRKKAATKLTQICFLASDDNDPNGTWYIHSFDGTTGGTGVDQSWSDYYELGYSQTGVYVSGNQIRWGNGVFYGGLIGAVPKTQLYTNQAATFYYRQYLTGVVPFADSPFYQMRCVEMQSQNQTFDMIVVSTVANGDNKIYLKKIVDPFGAFTVTNETVGVSAFSRPPEVRQPGDLLVPAGYVDCGTMNAMYVQDTALGRHLWLTFMVSHTWSGDNAPRVAIRTIDLNLDDNSKRIDEDQGRSGSHYIYPFVVSNYRGHATICFSRCGPNGTENPEARVYGYMPAYNASDQIRAANAAFTADDRWGDYHGGSLDWGDYTYNGGAAGKQKGWLAAQYADAATKWGHGVAGTLYNDAVGALNVQNFNFSGFWTVGNAPTPTLTWTVSHGGGDVGIFYGVDGLPNWLTAVSGTRGEVWPGYPRTVTLQVNNNVNSLPFGRHSATIRFFNLYTQASITRTVNISLGKYLCPNFSQVMQGEELNGNLTKVCDSDNQYFDFLSAETQVTEVRFRAGGGADHPQYLYTYFEAQSARSGLSQQLHLFNYNTGQWDLKDGRSAPIADLPIQITESINADNYIDSTGTMSVKVKTLPINDEDPSQDGWVLRVDRAEFYEFP